ncbi:hypothetical protein [Mycobacterium sp. 050134]|uniref:hypothetical protein n=1 Tax=Mycobacterium sp. 050134 TaxID=3096111 RepID=UPI002ED87557
MVAPTFDVRETDRASTARVIRADGECLRYRLEVVAFSAADARVRRQVLSSLDGQATEVALWGHAGQGWPLGVHRATANAQHLLSAAARTFKSCALVAAEIPCDAVDPTEALLCDMTTHSPAGVKLIRLD